MAALRCYLDYNATSPLRESAKQACVSALACVGNPSSIHYEGREARGLIEQARRQVGALVGAAHDRVVFTSGATEGANLVLMSGVCGRSGPQGVHRLLVSATEHAAVLRGHRFPEDRVAVLPVDRHGRLDLSALTDALSASGGSPALLAVQAANNETGVLQPVRRAADLVHAAGGLVVCDAVQIAGRLPFDMAESGADVALLSGHKIGGPQGTGAVVLADGVTLGPALLRGGGQERGLRSGTENVAGLAGFGAAAAEAATSEDARSLLGLRQHLEDGLMAVSGDLVVFGAEASRLPNTTCFAVPNLSAETLLIALDLEGFAISSGSACSSGKVSRSHVLEAMAIEPHLSKGALRVSFGWASTLDDATRFIERFGAVVRRMQRRPLAAAA
jgi:cysteine desulfurase